MKSTNTKISSKVKSSRDTDLHCSFEEVKEGEKERIKEREKEIKTRRISTSESVRLLCIPCDVSRKIDAQGLFFPHPGW